jgi:hypothetical protein
MCDVFKTDELLHFWTLKFLTAVAGAENNTSGV